MGQLVRKEERNTKRWQYLVSSGLTAVAAMYIFVMYVVLPAQKIFFWTMGSFSAVISVIWLPFLAAGALSKFAEYNWNMFNRYSMISHSYAITEVSLLAGLPSAYAVYGNVQVGDAEISHVVIGPNGVFVVSDRSLNGTIYDADEAERRWEIEKVGRGGTKYTSSMANPMKQVKWQIHQLADCLKKNDCPKIWIEGAVLFSSGVIVSHSDKVFTSPDALIDYIVHYEPRYLVNVDALAKAKRILEDLSSLEGASGNTRKQSKGNEDTSPFTIGILATVVALSATNLFSDYQLGSVAKEIQHNKVEPITQQRESITNDYLKTRDGIMKQRQAIDAQRNAQ